MTPDRFNRATAGNVFMLGAGGIFVVWFSAYFGRLPVLAFFQSLNLATSAWSGSATTFESFEAARILHGFFATVAAAVSHNDFPL
jgi:ABC-type transport system involved in cytochrome c biogenesis permease subunit